MVKITSMLLQIEQIIVSGAEESLNQAWNFTNVFLWI